VDKDKRKKRIALIRSVALLLIFVFLLSYASFSWIKREWSPKIYQDNISIQTSGALVFKFDHTGQSVTTSATVNEILGETSFALKPVSSSSGMVGEFFSIEYADTAGNETFSHLNYRDGYSSEVNLGKSKGYVVLNFKLQILAEESDKDVRYIYLNPESYIETAEGSQTDVADAVRISIYCKQAGMTAPIIVGTDKSAETHCVGVTNAKTSSGLFTADKEKLFDVFDPTDPYCNLGLSQRNEKAEDGVTDILKTQDVKKISDYDGGLSIDHSSVNTNKVLFQMKPGDSMDVTVCIWLEGEDPLCNDQVTDNKLNLRLQFSAWVEDVSATNQTQIN